jgi:hypothetical protein
VKGCSCKPYEYSEEQIQQSEQELAKRADASGKTPAAWVDFAVPESEEQGAN